MEIGKQKVKECVPIFVDHENCFANLFYLTKISVDHKQKKIINLYKAKQNKIFFKIIWLP